MVIYGLYDLMLMVLMHVVLSCPLVMRVPWCPVFLLTVGLLLCWLFLVYVSTVSLARCGGPAWLTLAYMRDVCKREGKIH